MFVINKSIKIIFRIIQKKYFIEFEIYGKLLDKIKTKGINNLIFKKF
jgi:hypothetical protein